MRYQFILRFGSHIDTAEVLVDGKIERRDATIRLGEKFTTESDLRGHNGGGAMSQKFEFAGEVGDAVPLGLVEK